ncbi:MAG: hypothetical protein AAF333_11090 [Planctomycetota bacterium]
MITTNPDWYVGLDTDRQRICGSHLPFPAFGHLRAAGGGFDYLPEVWRFEV